MFIINKKKSMTQKKQQIRNYVIAFEKKTELGELTPGSVTYTFEEAQKACNAMSARNKKFNYFPFCIDDNSYQNLTISVNEKKIMTQQEEEQETIQLIEKLKSEIIKKVNTLYPFGTISLCLRSENRKSFYIPIAFKEFQRIEVLAKMLPELGKYTLEEVLTELNNLK